MKNISKFLLTISFLNLSIVSSASQSFDDIWYQVQKEYKIIKDLYNLSGYDQYCHSNWKNYVSRVKKAIEGKPNRNFLKNSAITSTMVRGNMTQAQEFEQVFLKKCLSNENKRRLGIFKDVSTAWVPHKCKAFNCSVNTLGHLFYATTVFELARDKKIESIVEFGSGYGNLARVFKMMDNDLTLFLFDLPELVALQAIFLKDTLKGVEVILHSQMPEAFNKGAIHILPIYLLDGFDVDVDVFISTFALSETTKQLQVIIQDKNFFNSDICYISGQLDGWGGRWENHDFTHKMLRNCYSTVLIHPFHIFFNGNANSYDAIAVR